MILLSWVSAPVSLFADTGQIPVIRRTMKIVVVANISKPKVRQAADEMVPWMNQRAQVVAVDTDTDTDLARVDADAIIIFGGDGTLLSAARRLNGRAIPMLGVNFGRLGFLASFTPAQFKEGFEKLVARKIPITSRMMLEASVVDSDVKCCMTDLSEVASKRRFVSTALNDAVITAGPPFRMIELLIGPDTDPGVKFLGDGMIISTPSGSTAYSMSAGGPILNPTIDAICITPICPHSLSFRPIVISSQQKVLVTARRVNKGTTLFCDGQASTSLKAGDKIVVARAGKDVLLVENPESREWRTLAEKLNWAASPRYNASTK
jgi:NAD+ kinase